MAAISARAQSLLDEIRQMPAREFDAFLERALSVRAEQSPNALSPKETILLQRINQGLSLEFRHRYQRLVKRRRKGVLTADEHRELLQMNHDAEAQDTD